MHTHAYCWCTAQGFLENTCGGWTELVLHYHTHQCSREKQYNVIGFQKLTSDCYSQGWSSSKRSVLKLYKGQMERQETLQLATVLHILQAMETAIIDPYLVVLKPMTDLCWTFQQNSTAIFCAINTRHSLRRGQLWQRTWIIWIKGRRRYLTIRRYATNDRETIRSHSEQDCEFTPPSLVYCPHTLLPTLWIWSKVTTLLITLNRYRDYT